MEGDPKKEYEESKDMFKKYLKEKEGQPIDPKIKETGEEDIKDAEQRSFSVGEDNREDDPDERRRKIIAGNPILRSKNVSYEDDEGEYEFEEVEDEHPNPEDVKAEMKELQEKLNEPYRTGEGLSEQELLDAKIDLENLKSQVSNFLERNRKEGGIPKISQIMRLVIDKLHRKYGISGEFIEMPSKIDNLILKYQKALRDISEN